MRKLPVLAALAVAAVGALAVAAPGVSVAAPRLRAGHPWFDKGLDVVGGPVASGSRFVVLVSGPGKSLWLEGVAAATGAIGWRVAVTRSYATPGVYAPPAVADGVALALEPASGYATGAARIVGINVATGRRAWYQPAVVAATDLPETCIGSKRSVKDFCVPVVVGSASRPSLAMFNPLDGVLEGHQADVFRALDYQLFELNGPPATLVELGPAGRLLWKRSIRTLFGSGGYDPGYGWAFNNVDGMEIGDVGTAQASASSSPIGSGETIGVTPSGAVAWRRAGTYLCNPSEPFTVSFLCTGTGTLHFDSTTKSVTASPGATEVLHGFDPSTGRLTWRFVLKDVARFAQLGGVPLSDGTHLVVGGARGTVVLDLANGSTAAPAKTAVYWCGHLDSYQVIAPKGQSGSEVGGPQFSSCRADGGVAVGPGPVSSFVGATAAGVFAWPSPTGLAAIRG